MAKRLVEYWDLPVVIDKLTSGSGTRREIREDFYRRLTPAQFEVFRNELGGVRNKLTGAQFEELLKIRRELWNFFVQRGMYGPHPADKLKLLQAWLEDGNEIIDGRKEWYAKQSNEGKVEYIKEIE